MFKKSTSTMYGLSFGKNPRPGQKDVFDRVSSNKSLKQLNIQLPTGYGKSFVNAGAYSILKSQNRVNRLLIIVPTIAQKEQFEKDGHIDFKDAGVDGNLKVIDAGFFAAEAIRMHRTNEVQVFVVTSQALIARRTLTIIQELMSTGSWMVTVDEYHHYGIKKSWGTTVCSLNYSFILAMSATPYRAGDDGAFGEPDIKVSYRDGVRDGALKPLEGHAYSYRLDIIKSDGDVCSYYTDELFDFIGTKSPEDIDKFMIERQMRWSPKYISPLISIPLERMIRDRIETGFKLQAIIGAMSVSHADMVCTQAKTMFPDLKIDWVGTGSNGRKQDENRDIIEKFCPPKDSNGLRVPTLDVLIHVGMAGEGLDAVNVSEVIHLNSASINNSNNQENGRAARYLHGVIGYINFDSCSQYSTEGYLGRKIMDAMDCVPPSKNEPNEPNEPTEYKELPEEPKIQIYDMELLNVNSGMPEVKRMAKILREDLAPKYGVTFLEADIENPESNINKLACELYKNMREKESSGFNEKSKVCQMKEAVTGGVRCVAGLVIKVISKNTGMRVEKTLVGDLCKRINQRKKRFVGPVTANFDDLKKHYQWIKQLEKEILKNKEVPGWLA